MQQDRTATVPTAPHPVDNVHQDEQTDDGLTGLLVDFSRRISSTPDRVFTSKTLLFTLTMSARLTNDCSGANHAAYESWMENKTGSWHTREKRERSLNDAHDFADYVWDEASADARRAHALLFDHKQQTVSAAQVLERIRSLTGASRRRADAPTQGDEYLRRSQTADGLINLIVDFDNGLGLNSQPLHEVRPGTVVEANIRVEQLHAARGGRGRGIVAGSGGRAIFTLDHQAYKRLAPTLKAGTRATIRGTVTLLGATHTVSVRSARTAVAA